MLKKHPAAKIRVLAVWEPILLLDSKPGSLVLNRFHDHRVRQYWDADRVVAEELAHHGDPKQNEPECCFHRRGVLWDLTALYPANSRWESRLPLALVFGGPVVGQMDAVNRLIESAHASDAPADGSSSRARTPPAGARSSEIEPP